MASHTEEHIYHPKDAVSGTLKTSMYTGAVGLFASAVQNTLLKQNVGPWGVFVRSGNTIGIMTAIGGTYEFVKTASANLREKEDHWNVALGGFFSGAILGFRARTFPALLGYGAGAAIILGTFDYTGGSLFGAGQNRDEDGYERLERIRKSYRKSGEETVATLGEGRGIYAPGYDERRRQRIKQAYGIDVPETPAPAS